MVCRRSGPRTRGRRTPIIPKGIVFQPTAGSIGGVVYLPYCSPCSIAAGTDRHSRRLGRQGGRRRLFAHCVEHRSDQHVREHLPGMQPAMERERRHRARPAHCEHPGELLSRSQYALGDVQPGQWLHAGRPRSRVQVGVPAAGATAPDQSRSRRAQCGFNDFYLPGPYPAVNPLPLFAHLNPNVNTPIPAGCTAQYPAVPPTNGGGTCGGTHPFVPPNAQSGPLCSATTCPLVTGNQVMAGYISGPNIFNAGVNINGVTEARFNMSNATKDPHWWVVVGGRGWIGRKHQPDHGITTQQCRPRYQGTGDRLYRCADERERRVHPDLFRLEHHRARRAELRRLPSGERGAKLDASPGDFTGNGARLCGNTTTRNGLTTGPGCIIVFKQQYLSPLGSGPHKGN